MRARRGLHHRLIAAFFALMSSLWPLSANAQTEKAPPENEHPFDIGIIIDSRPLPTDEKARALLEPSFKADVDALFDMLDRQMYIENVMVFERPTIEVICDVFGCPEEIEPVNPFPPLIWQITREAETRLVVYFIGNGLLEGLKRKLLFKRVAGSPPGDVVALDVEWLHAMLENAGPDKAILMLDADFAPRNLPCASEDPRLINDTLLRVRKNYQRIMREHWNRTDNFELSATTPVQPAHCDRFDLVRDGARHSMFTKFLLEGIGEGAADRDQDGLVDLGEIEAFLDDRIKRAARFQWGRLQNVRAVGSDSQPLASVEKREIGDEPSKAVAWRAQSDQREGAQAEVRKEKVPETGKDEGPGASEPKNGGSPKNGQDDPNDPSEDGPGSDFQGPGLTTNTDPGSEQDPPDGTDDEKPGGDEPSERSAACDWVADSIGPFTTTLVSRLRGDVVASCTWATDRSEPELGPFAEIFTPVIWRVGRSKAQDAVACLLDCGGGTPADADDGEDSGKGEDPGLPTPEAIAIAPHGEATLTAETDQSPAKPDTDVETADRRLGSGPPSRASVGLSADKAKTSPAGAGSTSGSETADATSPAVGGDGIVGGADAKGETASAEGGFEATTGEVRWLQMALTVDNRDPGPIDGVLGEKTREAVRSWRRKHAPTRTGDVTEKDFQEIIEAFGQRFGQLPDPAPAS
ncbi:MAG: peptidoglycan-binding protein [Geminicoccaceae bacterium]